MADVRNFPQVKDETPKHNVKDARSPSREEVEASWDDEKRFHNVLSNYTAFNFIIQANKKSDPAYCEQLMKHIMQCPSVFDAIFVSRADLIRFAKRGSHPLAELALQYIIEHPEEIKRLVKDEHDVEVLNEEFKDQCSFAVKEDAKEFTVEVKKLGFK